VKLLLEKDVDIDSKGEYGQTPLSRAATYEKETIAKLLFEKDAQLDLKDNNGQTPL
jgi:ankyrin repeat protein